MNIDRLLKLLKLANHNPNDAEANSAARRACKLLGEENYKWLEGIKKGAPVAQPVGATGGGTWNDVHRSTKPFWRSTRPPPTEESERKQREQWERANREYERQRTRPPPPRDPFTGRPFNPFWEEQPFTNGFDWEKYDRESRKTREGANEGCRKKREAHAQNWTWTSEPDYRGFTNEKGYKKVYKQVCRDCTVCKITRLTTDEDTPYVCYFCRTKV